MRIDIKAAFREPPSEQDFIFPGFLAGTVAALVAPGGTGKSMLALQMACAVASEQANSTGLEISRHGRVHYVNLEDPQSELRRRLHFLRSQTQIDEATEDVVTENVYLDSRMGEPTDLMSDNYIKTLLKQSEGVRLVIIDTISRAHQLEENDNGAMARLLGRMEMLAAQTGAGVLFLHHTSKAAALSAKGDHAHSARGASALTDNARLSMHLVEMTPEEAKKASIAEAERWRYVRYTIGKRNYGEARSEQWFERSAGGILKPAKLRGGW